MTRVDRLYASPRFTFMTLLRTIKRRERRHRAKQRTQSSTQGRTFVTPKWIVQERLRQLESMLSLALLVNRRY